MAADLRAALPELAGLGPAPALSAAPAQASPEIGAATVVMPVAGLHLITRFDTEVALKRLAEPRGEDRRLMAPVAERPALAQRFFGDGPLMIALALIAAATAAAAYIALS